MLNCLKILLLIIANQSPQLCTPKTLKFDPVDLDKISSKDASWDDSENGSTSGEGVSELGGGIATLEYP
jgi:hypothetical protein